MRDSCLWWWWWWRGGAGLLLLLLGPALGSSLFPGDPPPRPPTPPPHSPPYHVLYYDHSYPPPRPLHHQPGGGGGSGGGRTNAFLDFHDGLDEVGESWEDDEAWWEGVEEVVLTNSFTDGFYAYEEQLYEDDLYDINYTCTDSMPCDDFAYLPPPPDSILTLPPPPVPPFLTGAIGRLQEEGRKEREEEKNEGREVDDAEEEEDEDEEGGGGGGGDGGKWANDECSLCEWATGGNNTLDLLPPPPEPGVGGGMVGVLVGVALVSAAVGAAVMVVLLRCRKFKILPSGRDSCPMLMRGTWTKGSATSATTGGDAVAGERGGTEAIKDVGEAAPGARPGGGTTNTGWSMKLWRRGSSQERPLRPSSSQGSENSYTEEPYVNADAQSAVYAELNSTTASTPGSAASAGAAYRPYSLNTYSEIPDPLRPVSLRAYISESTYENAGYVISEAGLEQPESSAGSASTPSSAYYSDVSSSETHNNKKKKKKKKNEERSSAGLQRCLELPNISSSVAIMNRHNLLAGRGGAPPAPSIHPTLHTREILPLALELLPQHLALDTRGGESVLPPLQPNMAVIHTASQVQTLPNNKGATEPRPAVSTCPRTGGLAGVTAPLPGVSISGHPGVTTPGPEEAPGAAGVPTSITGQGLGGAANPPESLPVCLAEEEEDEDSSHRPLPPLPSRQQQGPQRRGVYLAQSKQDQPLPPVPSEYV